MSSNSGRGRPTKYNLKLIPRVTEYTKKCLKEGIFPTIEGLATKLKLGTRTLYDWESYRPDFSHAIDNLRDTQRELLGLELADMKIEKYDSEIVSSFIKNFMKNPPLLWEKMDLPKKQALLRKVFVGELICHKDRVVRTNELSPSFQVIESMRAKYGGNVTPRRSYDSFANAQSHVLPRLALLSARLTWRQN